MLNEIRDIYTEENNIYIKILKTLEGIDVENIDQDRYQIELENIDYLVNKIGSLNLKIEQLKALYVTKYDLEDFTGREIRKIEETAAYEEFKNSVNNTSKLIMAIKKMNDDINRRLQRKLNGIDVLRRSIDKSSISKSFLFPQGNDSGSKIDEKK